MKAFALGIALVLAAGAAGGTALQTQKQGSAAQRQEQEAKKVVDPACGMTIDPAKAAGKSEYKGTTYFFCSDHCKRTFDANPEDVLNKAAQKKK
jgi:YHS domain-containing protein